MFLPLRRDPDPRLAQSTGGCAFFHASSTAPVPETNEGAVVEGVGNATLPWIDWGDVPSARRTGLSARRPRPTGLNGAMFRLQSPATGSTHPEQSTAAARFPRFVHGAGPRKRNEAWWSKGWETQLCPGLIGAMFHPHGAPDRPHVGHKQTELEGAMFRPPVAAIRTPRPHGTRAARFPRFVYGTCPQENPRGGGRRGGKRNSATDRMGPCSIRR